MRIRVVIQRHLLSPTKIWWDLESSFEPGDDRTVFAFLSKISVIVPLEDGNWGLEDYAVEIQGFEVLHFQEIDTVFRDGDEVVIRPLSGTEIRQRKRSGRRQISIYGRKLIDGTPLGRTMVKPAPDRPPIEIPPRKRLRIDNEDLDVSVEEPQSCPSGGEIDTRTHRGLKDLANKATKKHQDAMEMDEQAFNEAEEEVSLFEEEVLGNTMALVAGGELGSEDESDDEDFEPENDDDDDDEDDDEKEEQEEREAEQEMEQQARELSPIVDAANFVVNGELDQSEDEGEFLPESEEESDDSEEESVDASNELSDSAELADILRDVSKPASSTSATSQSPQNKSSHPSSSSSNTPTTKRATAPGTLPHQANKRTKSRNQRKKNSRALNKLKQQGILPSHADHDAYKQWLAANKPDSKGEVSIPAPSAAKSHPQPRPALQEIKGSAADSASPPNPSGAESESESGSEKRKSHRKSKKRVKENKPKVKSKHKKAFNKARKQGTIPESWDIAKFLGERAKAKKLKKRQRQKSPSEDSDVEMEGSKDATPVPRSSELKAVTPFISPPTEISSKRKDPEVDLVSVKRDVFNEHRPGRKGRKIRYDDDGNIIEEHTFAPAENPNVWKKKIALSAVECELKDVQLPKPDFPFVQPYIQEYGQNQQQFGKKQKRKSNGSRDQEYYDDGYGNGYEYGYDTGYHDESYDENFYDEPSEPAPVEEIEDLPPLPDNVAALSPLTQPVLPGTVLAFKQLTMDENYRPILADYRTAIVEAVYEEDEGPWLEMRLAKRDRPKMKFDEETGERILGRFEMPGAENDAVDGKLELMLRELIEPRIVRLPERAGEEGDENGEKEDNDEKERNDDEGESGEEDYSEEEEHEEEDRDEEGGRGKESGCENLIEEDDQGNSGMHDFGEHEREDEGMDVEREQGNGIEMEPSLMDVDHEPPQFSNDPIPAEEPTDNIDHSDHDHKLRTARGVIVFRLQPMDAGVGPHSAAPEPVRPPPLEACHNPLH